MRYANLAVRFLVELVALAALAYWGVKTGTNAIAKLGLSVGAPVLGATVWGVWVAPRARRRLADPWRLLPEFAVWGAAALALWATGWRTAAVVLLLAAA